MGNEPRIKNDREWPAKMAGGHFSGEIPIRPFAPALVTLTSNFSEGRKWGVRSVVVEFGAFWGAPIFRPEVPKPFENRYLGTSGLKIGAPQKIQNGRRKWPAAISPGRFQSGHLPRLPISQGESNMHQVMVSVLCRLRLPPFP